MKYAEKGYEFVYEAEVTTNVGMFKERRTVFFPETDFNTALEFGDWLMRDAEMDEGVSNVYGISLVPKIVVKEKES